MLSEFIILGMLSQLQAPVPISKGQSFSFDYPDDKFIEGQINRFEFQIDFGSWVSVGIPASQTKTAGITTYLTPIPPLLTGEHTASARACNPVECSEQSNIISFIMSVKPTPPTSLKIVTPLAGR